jgi:hypothetical protein
MTRLHADVVEVRTRAEPAGPVPEQFLWRGRRYVVREVLARWTASGAWWTGSPQELDDRETQWWRVEASDGGAGTYDLCLSWSTGRWTLRRVLD